tara:strand:+ start:412 stop:636 length:225 start_codon:yes stop_codon:yes gene_type:complete
MNITNMVFDEDMALDDEQSYETIMNEIYTEVFGSMDSAANVTIIEDLFDDQLLVEESIMIDYDSGDEIVWIPEN